MIRTKNFTLCLVSAQTTSQIVSGSNRQECFVPMGKRKMKVGDGAEFRSIEGDLFIGTIVKMDYTRLTVELM